MNSYAKKSIVWVDSETKLQQLVIDLEKQLSIGVDTESDSLYAYTEKVCLIQISTPENDYLLDPLNINDLRSLESIFSSTEIEKVFHAAEYDILCLKRDFGFQFNNLFDTMLASRILGRQGIGLSNLLQDFYNIEVNKKYQRANWGKRPLNDEMLIYASMDSHYLIDLADKLRNQLKQENLIDLAEEDFTRISKVEPNHIERNGDQFWKYIKGNILTPQQTTVFFELCKLREELAARRNSPPFKVFNTKSLIDLAQTTPGNRSEMNEVYGLSPKMIERHGSELLHAIRSGLAKEPTYRPHKPRPNEAYLHRYERLKSWRKEKAEEKKVESDVILPKEYLDYFAHKNPGTIAEAHEIMIDIPYRFSKYGQAIINLLSGG